MAGSQLCLMCARGKAQLASARDIRLFARKPPAQPLSVLYLLHSYKRRALAKTQRQDPTYTNGNLTISLSLFLCTLRQLHSFLVILTLLNLHTHSGAGVIAAAFHPLIHTTIVVTSLLTPAEPAV